MHHPKTLPWESIKREVLRAIRACNQRRKFVSTQTIAQHIYDNIDQYPHFADCTFETIQYRASTAMNRKLGWKRFNSIGGRGAAVYIDPRVKI